MLLTRGTGRGKDYNYWARVMSEWSWWRTKRKEKAMHISNGRGLRHNLHVLSV